MTPGQRGGLALAFVAAITVVLIRPVLEADDSAARGLAARPTPVAEESETAEPTPTEEPTPTPSEMTEPETVPPRRLSAAFPESCLTPQPLPVEPGLLAATSGPGITLSAATGEQGQATLTDIPGPVGFSPSGDYLLSGSGLLFQDGRPGGDLFGTTVEAWAWSPQADCALAIDGEGRLLIAEPGDDRTLLLDGSVRVLAFAISPGRVAVVTEDFLSVYDVRSRRIVGQGLPLRVGAEVVLAGWRGASLLVFTEADDGAELHAITPRPNGRPRDEVLATALAPVAPSPCGDRLIAVTSAGALLDVETGEQLTDTAYRFGTPACSPGGTLIAAPRYAADARPNSARMAILDSNGGFLQNAGPGGRGAEVNAEWSPSGSQLIFVKQTGRRSGTVWYASTSGGGSTEIPVALAPGSLDWNVSPPTGLPVAAN
jgi:hypothetical protein